MSRVASITVSKAEMVGAQLAEAASLISKGAVASVVGASAGAGGALYMAKQRREAEGEDRSKRQLREYRVIDWNNMLEIDRIKY